MNEVEAEQEHVYYVIFWGRDPTGATSIGNAEVRTTEAITTLDQLRAAAAWIEAETGRSEVFVLNYILLRVQARSHRP